MVRNYSDSSDQFYFLLEGDPPDPARAAEGVARSVCVALMPHLAQLKQEGLSPLAVRVCLDPDNVSIRCNLLDLFICFPLLPGDV